MEVSGQLYASAALSLGKDPLVNIRQKDGWVPGSVCRTGESREEKESCRESNASRPAPSITTILTELPWIPTYRVTREKLGFSRSCLSLKGIRRGGAVNFGKR